MNQQNPAKLARLKLKQQAKAVSAEARAMYRGETRGWQRMDSGGMPVMQFVPGGRMQPEIHAGAFGRWKKRSVSVLRRIPAPDWTLSDRAEPYERQENAETSSYPSL